MGQLKRFIDLTGQKFGTLTVIKRIENRKNHVMWQCICECGNNIFVSTTHLRSGHTKSCGCKKGKLITKSKTKHNMCNTRLYNIWYSMRTRCSYKKAENYSLYGNRGIVVCKEWNEDFINFYNWAKNNGYSDNLTIDRIDVNGNYCPENCRWVDRKTQARNTRKNHLITYNNETYCISEWAEKINISSSLLYARIYKLKWTIEKALTTKKRKK